MLVGDLRGFGATPFSHRGRVALGVQSRSVVESAMLMLHSGRPYGTDSSRQRKDHARRPSCYTAIEGFDPSLSGANALWALCARRAGSGIAHLKKDGSESTAPM